MMDRFESFTTSINKINKLIQKIKLVEMKEYDLKAVHVMCIYNLYAYEHLTASELVRRTLEDKAAISRALKQLAERQYVAYNPDCYNSQISLTESGKEIANQINVKAQKVLEAAGGALTDEQRATLYQCLDIISERLEAYCKAAALNIND